MAIAGLGLVSGFLALVLLMPPSALPTAVEAGAPAPVAAGLSSGETPLTSPLSSATPATPASASPSAAAASSPDTLHQPDQWTTAQAPAPSPADTDVEYENIDVSTPKPRKGAPPAAGTQTGAPAVDRSRARDLQRWKPAITAYSKRHYGEAEWALQPTCIVLHYTVSRGFPWNLVKTDSFAGEAPGLASHYVIDGSHIWELIPPDVRSRGAYGINHRAINIEMVAADGADLARRPETLRSCKALVRWLMAEYGIPKSKVYSHTAVSRMNPREIPEVRDLVDPRPYGKSDPGEQNMRTVRDGL